MARDPELFVEALARGLKVIETFGLGRTRQTVAEVARATGLSRAAVRRLLHTLVELKYMDFDGQKFALNAQTLRLGYAYLSSLPFWEVAQKRLEQLADKYGESWALGVREDDDVVFIARVQSATQIMSINLTIGSRLPLYASGVGQVLLAALSDHELDTYLGSLQHPKSYTPSTLTDPVALKRKVLEIRKQGWAFASEEYEYGLMALAVPVRDRYGRVVASLNVGSHVSRSTPERMRAQYLAALEDAAGDIGMYTDGL